MIQIYDIIKYTAKFSPLLLKQLKKLHYDTLIYNSSSKTKTNSSIIKAVTGTKINNAVIRFLNIDGKLTDIHHMITDSLNNYFLTS
jgi:hypothetical protein